MKTLVLGASTNPARYSNMLIRELAELNYKVEALGLREGSVANITISTGRPSFTEIHTITLYIGPQNQPPFYQYIIDLKPFRVIFNPGTENPEFEALLEREGIVVTVACSIMMLHAGAFFEHC